MVERALIVALLLAAAAVAPPLAHQVRKSRVARTSLKVGDAAPDFTLLTDEWKTVRLSEYRGKKNVFLAVYVLAFSEGCTKQMRAVQAGIDSGQIPTSDRSEEHTSELQSRLHLVCRLLLEKNKKRSTLVPTRSTHDTSISLATAASTAF